MTYSPQPEPVLTAREAVLPHFHVHQRTTSRRLNPCVAAVTEPNSKLQSKIKILRRGRELDVVGQLIPADSRHFCRCRRFGLGGEKNV
jgi:hypothetical protein